MLWLSDFFFFFFETNLWLSDLKWMIMNSEDV